MISVVATTSFVDAVIFVFKSPTGAKAAFSSKRLITSAGCKYISAISVPGGVNGFTSIPTMAASALNCGGGFLTVTRKYFAVVSGTAIVCCNTAPGGM